VWLLPAYRKLMTQALMWLTASPSSAGK